MAGAWGPFLNGLAYLESNRNPQAGNKTSTAKGAFQFLDGTAREAAQKYGIINTQSGTLEDQTKATEQYIRAINPKAAQALDAGDVNAAIPLLKGTWPSLPGGSQPQNAARYGQFQTLLGQNVDMPNSDIGPNTLALLQQNQAQSAQPPSGASDWGNPLIQAGAALMAINNPQGAAALSTLSNQNLKNLNEQRQLQQNNLQTITLPNGDVVQVDKSSGRLINTGVNGGVKQHVTRTNFLGDTEIGAFDPKTGKTEWSDPDKTAALTEDTFQKIMDARNAQDPNRPLKERREELIKMAPASMQDYVRARIEGRTMPSGGQGVAGRIAKAGTLLANAIDPESMDDSVYNARKGLRASESYGEFAKGFVSARTATEHAYQAKQLIDAINNKDIPLQNTVINKIKEATGDPNITNAQTALLAVANEFGRVVHGPGAQADAAVARWSHGLNPNGSPAQLYGGLNTMINDLADARIRSVEEQHRQIFKEEPPDFLGKRYRDMQSEIQKAAADSAANNTFHGTGGSIDLNKFYK